MDKKFDHSSFFVHPSPIAGSFKCNLDYWNDYRREYWEAARDRMQNPQNYPNGLTCPKCRADLYDTGQQISTSPSQLRVKCQSCNFRGERYE